MGIKNSLLSWTYKSESKEFSSVFEYIIQNKPDDLENMLKSSGDQAKRLANLRNEYGSSLLMVFYKALFNMHFDVFVYYYGLKNSDSCLSRYSFIQFKLAH